MTHIVIMTYCPLVHNAFTIDTQGRVGHCCVQHPSKVKVDWSDVHDLDEWYRTDPWMSEVRDALDNGIQHDACRVCWKYENNGQISKRMQFLRPDDGPGSYPTAITNVDLRLSNKCNLQCKMCHSASSSQIATLVSKLHDLGIDTGTKPEPIISSRDIDVQTLLELVMDVPGIQTIRLAGGEPFIMPEVEEMITKLIENGRTDLRIEFITNVTTMKTKFLSMLEQFSDVNLICSIDGVGDTVEYQRYPVKWSAIERNFIKMYNSKCRTAIAPSITMLNLLDMDRFLVWACKFPNSYFGYSEVIQPSIMDFRHVPLEVRDEFYERMKVVSFPKRAHRNWEQFRQTTMYEYKPMNKYERRRLSKIMNMWDYRCDIKFLDRYPWAADLMD